MFNARPYRGCKYLLDKRGRKVWYWINTTETSTKFRARYRSHPAGRVDLLVENNKTLTLADIHVPLKYRGLGIGKQLLEKAVQWARENAFSEIQGIINAHDGSTNLFLQEWYPQQGFIFKGKTDHKIVICLKEQAD